MNKDKTNADGKCEISDPFNAPLSSVTFEEPIEYHFPGSSLFGKNMQWNEVWLANHKVGNRLPRGKAFNAHRHLERRARSQSLGKLIVGSIKAALKNSVNDSSQLSP